MMEGKDFTTMSGPQLVEWFNAAVTEQPVKGFKPVTRFGSRNKAIKRCQDLVNAANGVMPEKKARSPRRTEPQVETSELLTAVAGDRDTHKRRATACLIEHQGSSVTAAVLAAATYGKGKENKGALMNVIGGIKATLNKKKLGYTIRTGKQNKETTFGLYSTQ
jgi:hypothetical protein